MHMHMMYEECECGWWCSDNKNQAIMIDRHLPNSYQPPGRGHKYLLMLTTSRKVTDICIRSEQYFKYKISYQVFNTCIAK